MDRVVAARKLIGDLVKAEQIEVRRVEIVGRDLVKLLDTLKRTPSGQDLGEWLEEHPQVTELSASTATLDELIDRYLRDPAEAAAVTAAREPELERQLREDPANASPYLVYADWLQERGDPLGELIALSVAMSNNSGNDNDVGRFERHLKRHEAYFFGESAAEIGTRVQLQWRCGFVQSIDALGDLHAAVWQRLLGLRVCELLESITLRQPCSDAVDAAIAEAAPESVRTLTLASIVGSLPSQLMRRPLRSLAVGAQSPVAGATFPSSLERLVLTNFDVGSPGPIELGVRDFEITTTTQSLAFLRKATFARLERLTFHIVSGWATPVVDILETLRVPALRHLGLHGSNLDLPTFRRLAELPLAAELHSLGLVAMGLTDETIGSIAATRGFSSLEEVDVSENELTRPGLDAARTLAPEVISSRQRRRGYNAEKLVRLFAGGRLQAAEEIADPKDWRAAGVDGDVRWARYRGEAAYELFITTDLGRYGCTCPSSIQPCKHVVALALVAERTGLPERPSNGIETRVTTRAGLDDLLLASIKNED